MQLGEIIANTVAVLLLMERWQSFSSYPGSPSGLSTKQRWSFPCPSML